MLLCNNVNYNNRKNNVKSCQ